MKCNFRCRDISNCEKDKTKCEFCLAFRCLNCLTDKDNCHKSAEERFLEYIEEQTKIEFTIKQHINIIKERILEFASKVGIEANRKESRLEILDKLLNKGVTYLDIYNEFKDIAYGIHPSRFTNKFGINKYQKKKMEETGFIKIAYRKAEKIMPGIYGAVPYYNPQWYFNTTIEDIENWRCKNIKGYEVKQLKMEL
ncbi:MULTISPECIES: hypothetical protein [Clostridium]|uniref:hypothetical protein n=1 Tax=Clostridium TaxID=1485 RepID=UPI000C082506|nr:hypothetical protein [Clostridium paraputrificum]